MKNIKLTNRKTKKSYFVSQQEHDQMKEAGSLGRYTVEFNAQVKPAPGFRPKEIRNLTQERFGHSKQEADKTLEEKNQIKINDEDKPLV